MNKPDLQALEDTLLREFKAHKALGGFDVHAAHITRLYELLYLIAKHLNKKPKRKKSC